MQGKEGGDRLCRYLPAKRVFGAVGMGGVERNEGFSEHYSVNRGGREGESKG